jgi:hypothetical protein
MQLRDARSGRWIVPPPIRPALARQFLRDGFDGRVCVAKNYQALQAVHMFGMIGGLSWQILQRAALP